MSQENWTSHFIRMASGDIKPQDTNFWMLEKVPAEKNDLDSEKTKPVVVDPSEMAVKQAKDKVIKAARKSKSGTQVRKRKSSSPSPSPANKRRKITKTVFD